TGFAYVTVDGVRYLLGMDFLSMAMVYKTEPVGEFATADEVYAEWWKLYMQRWNYLLPEIPLYSNEYYDVYNAKIHGVEEHPTNPYWNPASALIDWTSDDGQIILGSSTDLSGKFRFPSFGANSPGASDNDVGRMTSGLETVSTVTKDGSYKWNPTVVADHVETENEDGSKTFQITIQKDLVFSDGSPVTAKDYIVSTLVFGSPVGAQAAGRDHHSGLSLVGFDDYNTYTGPGSETGTKEFKGIRLIDEYTFAVTVAPDYLPYYYDTGYAAYGPEFTKMWIGDCEIKDDGNGVYLSDEFYAKEGDTYTMAAYILASALNTDMTYPYSGPYCVESYDSSDRSAVLVKNPNFKGNYEGTKPSIDKVIYKKSVDATQLEDLKAGNLDVLAAITGGDATNEALAMVDASEGKYIATHYSRAGYGKLGMRADYGPVQFVEVRQAIAYCMDRAKFAKDFTGGYGGVVDGPYYKGSWMYKAASAQGMMLDSYATSLDSAIAVLEQGGWVYNADGTDYAGTGVRYKKIPAAEATENDINYHSKDEAYKTEKVGDDYYMPLVINWYGTVNNEFTNLLLTGFMENENVKAAGFAVYNTIGDFAPMLDELYQMAVYGYYSGSPLYCLFNFATGFNSAVYDYSYNWTVDPAMYDDYSICYVKDLADIYVINR
ncbi:MAG: hypothetical protein IJM57_02505, partial [Lachnospiraceae bacterium]|nr:hypothetical protein [Lachnospiraceae bacterium]